MTPKQILDSFSETLMRDERILSAPERALVATLLQHAKTAAGEKPETQEAVRAVIASAVGETVAQRAFAVLGGSIVERILESSTLPHGDSAGARTADTYAGPHHPWVHNRQATSCERQRPPSPHGAATPERTAANRCRRKTGQTPAQDDGRAGPADGAAQGPGVKAPHKAPQPPSGPMRGEPDPPTGQPQPQGPGVRAPRSEPEPPTGSRTTVVSESMHCVADRPAVLPAQCVVLDEFLAPQELVETHPLHAGARIRLQRQRSGFSPRGQRRDQL